MGVNHLSRREILNRISLPGSGSLLLSAFAQKPDTSAPAILLGRNADQAGKPVASKFRVIETRTGREYLPTKSIRTMPAQPGYPDIRRHF